MVSEVVRRRLELRRSNVAVPHRNRHREHKTGQAPWDTDDWHDMSEEFKDEGA